MKQASTSSERLFYLICGVVLVVAGIWSSVGGVLHPLTGDPSLGAGGSIDYWLNFAAITAGFAQWEGVHVSIMAGRVLMALGSVGLFWLLRERGEVQFSSLAVLAMGIGATLWAVAFIFDGYVSLAQAQAVMRETDEAHRAGAIAGLRGAETVLNRSGLVGITIFGLGQAALGVSILAVGLWPGGALERPIRLILGILGVVLGLFPAVGWLTGLLTPSPFNSALWRPFGGLVVAWFIAAGITLLLRAWRGAQL
jgi:hypothetical protein